MKSPILGLGALALALGVPAVSLADVPVQATALTSCGAMSYTNGRASVVTQDLTGKLCVSSAGGSAPSPYQVNWIGHQAALSFTISTALTPTATATIASVVVDAASPAIRCNFDGTAPTSANGSEVQPGGTIYIVSATLANVKCIPETGTGIVNVQYGK